VIGTGHWLTVGGEADRIQPAASRFSIEMPTAVSVLGTVTPVTRNGQQVPSIEEIWPDAVHTLPQQLPDGRDYQILGFIDATTLLISTESSFENTDRLYHWDLQTGEAVAIGDLPALPEGVDIDTYPSGFAVGDGVIVWWFSYRQGDQARAEIWTMPVTGGEASRLTTIDLPEVEIEGWTADMLEGLGIADGQVHWSLQASGGVYQVPLNGGEVTQVPDSDGYHIVAWPWIGTPEEPLEGWTSQQTPGVVVNRELRNVETGEQRTAAEAEQGVWFCGPELCAGLVDNVNYVRNRDGSDQQAVGSGMTFTEYIALDRFALASSDGEHGVPLLLDLQTGTAADLLLRWGEEDEEEAQTLPGVTIRGADQTLLAWDVEGMRFVVNLGAIG